MASKELSIPSKGGTVVSIDLNNLNADAMDLAVKKLQARSGGGKKKQLPGQSIFFYKGSFYVGNKDNGVTVDEPVVLNVMNHAECFKRRAETDSGKNYNEFSTFARPFAGEELVDRATLGFDDETEWENDDRGNPMDPWTHTVVVPARLDAATDVVDTLSIGSKSGVNAWVSFLVDILPELKMRPGQLPVVELGSKTLSRKVPTGKQDKKGQPIMKEQSWDAPSFTLSGWTKAKDVDNGGLNGVQVTNEADDVAEEDTAVKTSARVAPKAEAKETAVPATAKKVRKTVN